MEGSGSLPACATGLWGGGCELVSRLPGMHGCLSEQVRFWSCDFHLCPVGAHTLLPGKGWPLICLAFHMVPPPIGTLGSKWNLRASFPVSLCLCANCTPNPVAHSHETGLEPVFFHVLLETWSPVPQGSLSLTVFL